PGIGIAAPTRNTARAPSVHPMRRRSSGTSKTLPIPAILSLDDLGLAAGLLELGLGAGGERVRGDRQLALELAVAEDLDQLAALHEAVHAQVLEADLHLVLEDALEGLEADDLVDDLERAVGEAAFRNTPQKRRLAALEADELAVARAGALALLAARGGLAGAGALAHAEAHVLLARARRALEAVEVEELGRLGVGLGGHFVFSGPED